MTDTRHVRLPGRQDVAVGQRIRERRRALGLRQDDLAAATGVSKQQIQKYERGVNRISISRLVEIADRLRCRLNDLAQDPGAHSAAPDLARLDALLQEPGALEMLEAYAALPAARRRTLLDDLQAPRAAPDASPRET